MTAPTTLVRGYSTFAPNVGLTKNEYRQLLHLSATIVSLASAGATLEESGINSADVRTKMMDAAQTVVMALGRTD